MPDLVMRFDGDLRQSELVPQVAFFGYQDHKRDDAIGSGTGFAIKKNQL
jgi:hypothetical protein